MKDTNDKSKLSHAPGNKKRPRDKEPGRAGAKEEKRAVPSTGGKKKEQEQLRQQLSAKEDCFLRAVADLENYRKRAGREMEEVRRFSNEELIRGLLPVLDSMEKALQAIQGQEKSGPLLEGMEMTKRQLSEVLTGFGLTRIECLGEKFDPKYHQAVLQEESVTHADGKIIEEYRPGYMLYERVIRASEVKVAKRVGKRDKGKPNRK